MKGRPKNRTWHRDQSGAVAVEFALLSPVLMIMMVGILVWGQYFWVAHTVQQVANNAARAALAGLDPAERETLARGAMISDVHGYPTLRPQAADIGVDSLSDRIVVSVRYDTAGDAFRVLDGLVPSPPKTVTRQAAVRLGGY